MGSGAQYRCDGRGFSHRVRGRARPPAPAPLRTCPWASLRRPLPFLDRRRGPPGGCLTSGLAGPADNLTGRLGAGRAADDLAIADQGRAGAPRHPRRLRWSAPRRPCGSPAGRLDRALRHRREWRDRQLARPAPWRPDVTRQDRALGAGAMRPQCSAADSDRRARGDDLLAFAAPCLARVASPRDAVRRVPRRADEPGSGVGLAGIEGSPRSRRFQRREFR